MNPNLNVEFVDETLNNDPGIDWYKGTGAPGVNQADAQSVATHELGHGGGVWRGPCHFDLIQDSVNCNPDAEDTSICISTLVDRATMCKGTNLGTLSWRSLEQDDKHTFNSWY